jgi:thiol-disulfide isomerase/thioredoxin
MQEEQGPVHAPEFPTGVTWLQGDPLTIASLRGRPVLLDFWDYTCVNCLRTMPYLVEWDWRYRDKGLTIVGVHAPEFTFARTAEHVQKATERLGIRYPVVLDNDYQIWRAFANQYWPAKYLIDADGFLRYMHFGEGFYQETEEAIQAVLRERDAAVQLPPVMAPVRDTDQPNARCYRVTPELYLGYRRGKLGNAGGVQQDKVARYELPKMLEPEVVYAQGPWLARAEQIESAATDRGERACLALVYAAKEVNLVMAPNGAPEYRLLVGQDGKPVGREDAGDDIEFDEAGRSSVRVNEPRMYKLVRNAKFDPRRLELAADSSGLGLYAFTFVTCLAE